MIRHTLCLFILAIFSLIPCDASDATGREGVAVVIKSQEISAYNDVAEGFQRDCQNNAINVKAIYDLKGDIENGKHIVLDVREIKPKPDIILTIGTLASTLAKKHIEDTPIIFCAVINHELLDLQGTNIYAISSGVPYTEQFAVLKKLFNTRKNIGILYDPIKTERIVSALTSLGNTYDYNFITEKVSSKKDVGDALKAISKKIDILWIVPDDTVISKESIDQFVETSRRNHLPIFCTSSALIKLGALISISPDYYSMGEQAAKIAGGLLKNPSQNSPRVEQPEKLKITINVKTAEILKVDVSPFLSLPDVVLYR